MHSILVTGGAGFIGSNFCHYWQSVYPKDRIFVLDALTYAGDKANLEGCDCQFIHACVTQIDFALKGISLSTIVHFAAESHVDQSIKAVAPFIQTNIVGTQAVIDYTLKHNIRLHHVSTDEVYGSLGVYDPPFTEQSRYNPTSPYAASKAASDHLVRAAVKTHGLKATISHGCNTFGPRQHAEKLIPTLLRTNPMPIYGDGKNRRQWVYVEDHCRAIDLIIAKGKIGESYNIRGIDKANLDIATLIGKPFIFVKDRPGHDFRYAVSGAKLMELGYEPEWPFRFGMKKTIEWYEHRPSA